MYLLKSDRFGMEISFASFDLLKLCVRVKIRPFRYGNNSNFKLHNYVH